MAEEANGNGRATIREVYELVGRVDDKLDVLNAKVDQHLIEAAKRDERLAQLEAWRSELNDIRDMRVRELIRREHESRHEAHMERDHPKTGEFLLDDVKGASTEDPELGTIRLGFRFSKWFIGIVLAAAVTAGVASTVNACARSNQIDAQTEQLQQENKRLMEQNKEILNYLMLVDPEPTPGTGSK